jgi:methyl-accepting chemotaxis protein
MEDNIKMEEKQGDLQTNSTGRFSIQKQISIGFSVVAIIIIIAISITLAKVMTVKTFADQIISHDLPSFNAYIDLDASIYKAQAALYKWLITHDPNYKDERQKAWNMIHSRVNLLNQYKTYEKNWTQTIALLVTLKNIQDKIENRPEAMDAANAASIIHSEIVPILNQISTYLSGPYDQNKMRHGGIFDAHFERLKNSTHEILIDMRTVEVILFSLIGVVVLSSLLIAYYTSRTINRYIKIFRNHSNNIAKGDLTKRLMIYTNDDMGQLGKDLNIMTESLAKVASQINHACQEMVSTLEEVRHASDIQSSGATEQASSINEITSSLEEIEKSSIQTIEKAKALGEVAERIREKGQRGLEAVEQSTAGMNTVREKVQMIAQTILELSNQTQQVGEITAVVNSLAQQSKMLALNASIEAAKAGDAGKGFAVVADEVKHLAEESEHSTTQVQKILEDIRHATEKAVMATEEGIKGVDHGTSLVEETGEVVRHLGDVIHEAAIASQQIEAAIRQEGIGIEQITSGMNEINQVTFSYVESVKQTTQALHHLASNVKNLKEYIDVYKI